MEERLVDVDLMFVTHDEPAEVGDPGDAPFHFPAMFVAAQLAPVLRGWLATVGFVWTNQIDAASGQSFSQRIGVGGLVVNQPRGIFPRPAAGSGDRHTLQGGLDQRRFVRGRRGKLNSQRNTLAACHHHPLRTLSTFGFANAVAPFFAGAKLPSAKVSSQSRRPCSSSSPRKARQMASQTPCSSQSRSRRQQVLGDGYLAGRSRQRAPERRTHKMPSKQSRWPLGGRPPRRERLIFDNHGSIFFHCSSVSSESCRDMKRIPFHVTFKHKHPPGANLSPTRF